MAIIHSGSQCAICREPLTRPFTATSGCAFAPEHPLFPYCDAPLHLSCLASWPFRHEFSRSYFDSSITSYRAGHGTLLHDAGPWFLACGPIVEADSPAVKYTGAHPGEPIYAEMRLADWPFRLYSPWRGWEAYILRGFEQDLAGAALDAAKCVIAQVRAIAPSQVALGELLALSQRRGAPFETQGGPPAA